MNNFIIYLLVVSLFTALVFAFYKLLFARLTFFNWNRWYIQGGVAIAIVLPALPFDYFITWRGLSEQQTFGSDWLVKQVTPALAETVAFDDTRLIHNDAVFSEHLGWLFWSVYLIGIVYMLSRFVKNVWFVEKMRRSAQKVSTGKDHTIYRQGVLPSFSFGRSIFLQEQTKSLTEKELDLIVSHELAHVRHKHTWDVLVLEIARIVFWFNPFLYYLSQCLREVHEYQADACIAGEGVEKMNYGRLLVKLATVRSPLLFAHTFSDSQIFNRIQMLTKPKSGIMQKLRFLGALPLMAIIVLVCSCLGEDSKVPSEFAASSATGEPFEATGLKIGKIIWEGNTKYKGEELSRILTVKPGDAYDSIRVEDALNGGAKGDGLEITSLYMDQGHLFFRIEQEKKVTGNIVDLTLKLYEGALVKIGKVRFSGIKKLNAIELIDKIETKPGELFSRIKLIHSQRTLSEMGPFDPKNIEIKPVPFSGPQRNEVDIEFSVKEI